MANAVACPHRSATRLPVGRVRISAVPQLPALDTVGQIAAPRVPVRNPCGSRSAHGPGRRLDSASRSSLTICCIRPFRRASICVTTPSTPPGHRSQPVDRLVRLPVDLRVRTSGLPTVSSKPSRRMISTSTASWSLPRPAPPEISASRRRPHAKRDVAGAPVPVVRSAGSRSACRLGAGSAGVDPSVMPSEGSSSAVSRQRPWILASAIVSPIVTLGRPATRRSRPAPGLLRCDTLQRLGHVELVVTRPSGSASLLARHQATCSPLRIGSMEDPEEREPADMRRIQGS